MKYKKDIIIFSGLILIFANLYNLKKYINILEKKIHGLENDINELQYHCYYSSEDKFINNVQQSNQNEINLLDYANHEKIINEYKLLFRD
jgi:hypothetical protein